MLQYQINIFWSDEDDMYVAAVPDLPGCSALGDTYDEALREVQTAMALWIDTAMEFGDPVPAPAVELAAPPTGGC
jgi:predicted RNase H-like HicB family nuclease